MFYTVVTVIIIIVSILLVLFVLVQNSKGGGLVSSLSSAGQIVGVRKSADVLEKGTWTLAVALMLLSFAAVAVFPNHDEGQPQSRIQEQVMRTQSGAVPTTLPEVPVEELDNSNTPATPEPAEPAASQE